MTNAQILKDLISSASVAMYQYPQYKGHFDGYVLCRVKRHIKTKAGLAFLAGELAIMKVERPVLPTTGLRFVTVWSARNRIDTSIPAADVEVL